MKPPSLTRSLETEARYGRGDYCQHFDNRDRREDYRRQDGFTELYFMVVLQWNFFLSRKCPCSGSPALPSITTLGRSPIDFDFEPFIFFVGGRFPLQQRHQADHRIGYPAFSVGASFLL
jgi:hypothetical protein